MDKNDSGRKRQLTSDFLDYKSLIEKLTDDAADKDIVRQLYTAVRRDYFELRDKPDAHTLQQFDVVLKLLEDQIVVLLPSEARDTLRAEIKKLQAFRQSIIVNHPEFGGTVSEQLVMPTFDFRLWSEELESTPAKERLDPEVFAQFKADIEWLEFKIGVYKKNPQSVASDELEAIISIVLESAVKLFKYNIKKERQLVVRLQNFCHFFSEYLFTLQKKTS